jgi:hypothetical protein
MPAQVHNIRYWQKTKIQRDIHFAGTNIYPQNMSGSSRMKIRTGFICSISAFVLIAGLVISTGCAFMAFYTKAFPGQVITFVERNRLHDVISEQDLLKGRLNEKTRARIKQIFGVEALIMCTYYDGSDGIGRKKLRVRIVDSATGAIVGSVITGGRDNFGYHCGTAIKALKTDLLGGS